VCLIVFAYKHHPDYKLIFVANRDEFYERPAAPAAFWKEEPSLLAGKDLKEGGTWCGITKTGRLAAITNYRDMKSIKKDAVSRGKIVTDFLSGTSSPELYSKALKDSADQYNGYSLIFGNKSGLYFFSNRKKELVEIKAGIHGLSNHLLNTPWYNVERSKTLFNKAIEKGNNNLTGELFEMLSDDTPSSDDNLPDTGLDPKLERVISPIFTRTEVYGTRSSTLILIDNNDNVNFIEKSLNSSSKEWKISSYDFQILNP
jgi:uncharacterized protein with NRDE domain